MTMAWTDQHVAILKAEIANGLSFSLIAAKLGPGFTRNSAIGKAHRLNLTISAAPRQRQARAKTDAPPKTNQRPVPSIPKPDNTVLVSIIELGNGCKWPIGDPRSPEFGFCGKTREDEKDPKCVYCEYHASLAYQPMAGRK